MNVPYSLRSEHIQDDEVSFSEGVISSSISVSRETRGLEEIGYSSDQEAHVEAALKDLHGTTIFDLNLQGGDVEEILEMADSHFQLKDKLREKYGDARWGGYQTNHMRYEGQKLILVGRCDQTVVSIACLDLRFIHDATTSDKKYLSVGIGPFFVPEPFRGRAHSIELSISVAYLCSVLLKALCHQIPNLGQLGITVYTDYPDEFDELEVHPFVQQVFDKLSLVREMLKNGYLRLNAHELANINFLPISLIR